MRSFPKAEQAMMILVAIGNPRASQILKHFKDDEKRTLLLAAKSLRPLAQPDLESLVKKFEADFSEGAGILDSSELMGEILSASMTAEEAEAIVNPAAATVEPKLEIQTIWDLIETKDPARIAGYLQSENLQIGAYLLSRLTGTKSAEVIATLERSLRSRLIARMMSIRSPSSLAIDVLETSLRSAFEHDDDGKGNEGDLRVASILNQLDKSVSEEVMSDLHGAFERDRVVAIRSMLFRFEDVARLSDGDRVIVLDQVQPGVMTLALRGAEPSLIELCLAAIGQRTRRMIENDLKTAGNAKPADLLDARRQVVATVLKLSREGRVSLPTTELAA